MAESSSVKKENSGEDKAAGELEKLSLRPAESSAGLKTEEGEAEENGPRLPSQREGKAELRDVVDDALYELLKHLGPESLYAVESTCRRFRRLAKHACFYKDWDSFVVIPQGNNAFSVRIGKDDGCRVQIGAKTEPSVLSLLRHLVDRGAVVKLLIVGGHTPLILDFLMNPSKLQLRTLLYLGDLIDKLYSGLSLDKNELLTAHPGLVCLALCYVKGRRSNEDVRAELLGTAIGDILEQSLDKPFRQREPPPRPSLRVLVLAQREPHRVWDRRNLELLSQPRHWASPASACLDVLRTPFPELSFCGGLQVPAAKRLYKLLRLTD